MIILKQNLPKLRIYWECFDPVHEFLTGIFKPFAAQYAYGSSLANSVASRLAVDFISNTKVLNLWMNQKKEFHTKRELFLKPFPSDLSLKKKDLDFTVFRDLKLLLQSYIIPL